MLSNRHIIFVPLIVLLLTAGLYADGCFVWSKGADLNEPTQKAIIYWKKGKEIMVLQVKYEGAAEDFAWIVPLPAKPKVSAIDADKSPFAEISLYTQLRRRWGYRGKDAGAEAEAKVTVLERKIVGVYDIAILAASDAGALGEWLNNNGYAFPEKRKDVLAHYTKKKWVYVAMRIDRKALESDEVKKLKSGELQPIRFTFAAKEMVYPLKISSVNAGKTEVLLYLLADAPMVVKSEHKQAGFSIEENIPYGFSVYTMRYRDPEYGTYRKAAGKELPLTWEALGLTKDKELSLCKYRAVYKVEEMTDDLVFAPFKPVPFWKERLREMEAEQYQWLRWSALSILAYHDADLLSKLAQDKDKHNREFVAFYPRTPKELLVELIHDEEVSVRVNLARNCNTPDHILHELAKDKEARVRAVVVSHPKTSLDIFRQLAEDNDAGVRAAVAGNGKTAARLLRKLASDQSWRVRMTVVYNPNMPKELLENLARDESEHVRAGVAQHRSTSTKVLENLARDNSSHVRMSVVYNRNIPRELLEQLACDESDVVRESVAINKNTVVRILCKLAKDRSAYVRYGVAANSNTPADIFLKLTEDRDEQVKATVAYNLSAPVDALRKLAKDNTAQVRITVARNPNTPVETLEELAKDKDANVSKAARLALEERGL